MKIISKRQYNEYEAYKAAAIYLAQENDRLREELNKKPTKKKVGRPKKESK